MAFLNFFKLFNVRSLRRMRMVALMIALSFLWLFIVSEALTLNYFI